MKKGLYYLKSIQNMTMICAQTRHNLSANDVVSWLENSQYMIKVVGLQVYGYWAEGKDGEMFEGYWWVAEIRRNKMVNTALNGGSGFRVYNGRKYFTVKNMVKWPKVDRFRVAMDGDDTDVPMLSSSYGFEIDFPYTYRDMYVTVRGKDPSKRRNKKGSVEEPIDRKKGLVLEILSKMKELKELM